MIVLERGLLCRHVEDLFPDDILVFCKRPEHVELITDVSYIVQQLGLRGYDMVWIVWRLPYGGLFEWFLGAIMLLLVSLLFFLIETACKVAEQLSFLV